MWLLRRRVHRGGEGRAIIMKLELVGHTCSVEVMDAFAIYKEVS